MKIDFEHGSVREYRREGKDSDFWAVYEDTTFIAILMTDELPFDLPVHQASITRINAESFVDFNDERLDRIIDSIDSFDVELKDLKRFN